MAASYKGGVVLGADTRTSTGAYVANRVTNKITQLAEKVWTQQWVSCASHSLTGGSINPCHRDTLPACV